MPGMGFSNLDPVDVFPAPHQLMEISSSELGKILFEEFQQIKSDIQRDRAAGILCTPAGYVFIHDLVETEYGHFRGNVIRIDFFHRQIIPFRGRTQGGVSFMLFIVLKRKHKLFLELIHLCGIKFRHFRIIQTVLYSRFCCNPPFGKRTRRELVA